MWHLNDGNACDERPAADFIYSEYLTTVPAAFRTVTWQIAEDYAKADLLLRLPGYCPMPAFKEVVDVPLVVRHSRRSAPEVSFLSCIYQKSIAQSSFMHEVKLVLSILAQIMGSGHLLIDPPVECTCCEFFKRCLKKLVIQPCI